MDRPRPTCLAALVGDSPPSTRQHGGFELVAVEAGASGFAAFGACGPDAVLGPLCDQAALELGDGAEDVEHELAGGGRGVDLLLEGDEGDLALLQLLDDLEQLAQRSAEAIEAHDHDGIALAGIVQERL